MLTGKCINPEIIGALALCGHGDKILIADGNYPLASKTGNAQKVYLGLTPGIPTVTDVLAAVQTICNVEAAQVMQPENGETPEIFAEFEEMLGNVELGKLGRWEFYSASEENCVRLAISTGEKRTYANILLTIGVA